MSALLWLLVIVLIVLWALGAFVVNLGGLVHLLLIVALVLVIIYFVRMMMGRHEHS